MPYKARHKMLWANVDRAVEMYGSFVSASSTHGYHGNRCCVGRTPKRFHQESWHRHSNHIGKRLIRAITHQHLFMILCCIEMEKIHNHRQVPLEIYTVRAASWGAHCFKQTHTHTHTHSHLCTQAHQHIYNLPGAHMILHAADYNPSHRAFTSRKSCAISSAAARNWWIASGRARAKKSAKPRRAIVSNWQRLERNACALPFV